VQLGEVVRAPLGRRVVEDGTEVTGDVLEESTQDVVAVEERIRTIVREGAAVEGEEEGRGGIRVEEEPGVALGGGEQGDVPVDQMQTIRLLPPPPSPWVRTAGQAASRRSATSAVSSAQPASIRDWYGSRRRRS
jgi:hypothetical protein